jgi:hypothetical protein
VTEAFNRWTRFRVAGKLEVVSANARRTVMPRTKPRTTRKKPICLDLDPYRGEWIALDPKTHRVVSHNSSLKVAKRVALSRGVPSPLMMPVPESDAYFVGLHA